MNYGDLYTSPIDYLALAQAYPPLEPCIFTKHDGSQSIDFKNAGAQRRLTEALLSRDFGLSLDLPEGRLCPAVPNRLNYLLWIRNILSASSSITQQDDNSKFWGLDIGTGASCIYPLMGSRLDPSWSFAATDIDELSLSFANRNIESNKLGDHITLLKSTADGPLLWPLSGTDQKVFDFTMCNPPFYSSTEDIARSSEGKEFDPHAVCTGAEVEMVTAGGEAYFVCCMIEESLLLKGRCRWFTSLLGKLSSLQTIVERLRKHSIDNYGIAQFIQGQTKRWAILWSFSEVRLPDTLVRTSNRTLHPLMPLPNTLRQTYGSSDSLGLLFERLNNILSALHVSMAVSSPASSVTIRALTNTWSRSARRNKAQPQVDAINRNHRPILECEIRGSILEDDHGGGECVFECRWLKGKDRGLFESFWSHVSRKIST